MRGGRLHNTALLEAHKGHGGTHIPNKIAQGIAARVQNKTFYNCGTIRFIRPDVTTSGRGSPEQTGGRKGAAKAPFPLTVLMSAKSAPLGSLLCAALAVVVEKLETGSPLHAAAASGQLPAGILLMTNIPAPLASLNLESGPFPNVTFWSANSSSPEIVTLALTRIVRSPIMSVSCMVATPEAFVEDVFVPGMLWSLAKT